MIIDSPVNYGLTTGQLRVIPQPEDSQIVLPPVITPTVAAMQPTIFRDTPGLAVLQETSTYCTARAIRPPSSVANQVTVVFLSKGYWTLELELSYVSDFAGTPAVPVEVQAIIGLTLTIQPLINLNVVVGERTAFARYTFLTNIPTNVGMLQPATAVAQNFTSRLTVNAIRIL